MSRLTDIRGALQSRLDDVAGFPPVAQRSYQGIEFSSVAGTPWARLALMTISGRPFDIAGDSRLDAGLFYVEVFQPAKSGTQALETVVDAVIAAYRPGSDLIRGSVRLWLLYAEPGPILEEPDWIKMSVTVSWRCKSQAQD